MATRSRENTAGSQRNARTADSQKDSKPGTSNSVRSNRTGAQFDDVVSLPSIFDEQEEVVYQREPTPRRRPDDVDSVRGGPEHRVSDVEQRPPCSCIPALSSKNVSSMLYDKVQCKHTGHRGGAHKGVVFFNDNWGSKTLSTLPHINNVDYHKNRPEGKHVPTIKTANAYPRGEYISEDDESDYETDSEEESEPENEAPHSARERDHRVSILESRRQESKSFSRQAQEPEMVREDTFDIMTDFEYTETELERKYKHKGKVLDPATGKIMHFKMRSDPRTGRFEREYEGERLTNGGYITAKLETAP